jgi:hypothetical protein
LKCLRPLGKVQLSLAGQHSIGVRRSNPQFPYSKGVELMVR